MALISPRIILASASPKRRELLAGAGYEFSVVAAGIDESGFTGAGISPREHAEHLALAKARAVAERFTASLVIGADTVVDFDGDIIGKAADVEEAESMIRRLFSAPHRVITAVAIVIKRDGVEIVESDSTTVFPRELSEQQIAEHLECGQWRDKAGAYAIKQGDKLIERIEGSLTNVMGLPLELLETLLVRTSYGRQARRFRP